MLAACCCMPSCWAAQFAAEPSTQCLIAAGVMQAVAPGAEPERKHSHREQRCWCGRGHLSQRHRRRALLHLCSARKGELAQLHDCSHLPPAAWLPGPAAVFLALQLARCTQVCMLQVPFDPWNTTSTTVCVAVDGPAVYDTYGDSFPASENCTTLNHRCIGGAYGIHPPDSSASSSICTAALHWHTCLPLPGKKQHTAPSSPLATL